MFIKSIAKKFSCKSLIRNHCRHLANTTNEIQFDKINHTGVVTLNRPKKYNALNKSMKRDFFSKLQEFKHDDQVKCILVKSTSSRAFCAGGDIREIIETANLDKDEYQLIYDIASLRKPYISLLNGITMGAGAGISMHGKYRVATEKTVFAMPETAIGFIADVGFYNFSKGLSDNIGLYMGLTGHRLKSKDVKRLGIATHFVHESDLSKLENDLYASSNILGELEGILSKYDQVCEGII